MIRIAVRSDLDRVLEIYAIARSFMKSSGNPDQWGQNYPDKALVLHDIDLGQLYVDETDGVIHSVFMFAAGPDPSYASIDGSWVSDTPYAVIHRVASDGIVPGAFGRCLAYCRSVHPHLRMDTYKDNHKMQSILTRAGFIPCGTVYVCCNFPMLAYELLPE